MPEASPTHVDSAQLNRDLEARGWAIAPAVLAPALVDRLSADLAMAYEVCRRHQRDAGLEVGTDGTLHHVVGMADSFLEVLAQLPIGVMRTFLDANVILNSYGGVINQRASTSYVHHMHRDVRSYTRDLKLMLNVLVMLDDFTIENGATHLLTGSHLAPARPDEEAFFEQAERAVAPKGSLLLFDARVWHAAGENVTDRPRRALTLTFTPPYLKPQLDYPRLMGYDDGARFPEPVRQLLGYHARIPANLTEWYQPPDQRFYKRDQG